ncbi:placenta-expressed transcript 1 protein [Ctenodactylus gundi]
MAVFTSMLLHLGLFLYLGLHLSSAYLISYHDNCTVIGEVVTTKNPDIKVKSEESEDKMIYTMWLPVNNNVSALILRVVDKTNKSMGTWNEPETDCNNSVIYHVPLNLTNFKANWVIPKTEDVTEVTLQVYNVYLNHSATFSSQKLERQEISTTPTSKTTSNYPRTTPTENKNTATITTKSKTTNPTTTTTKSKTTTPTKTMTTTKTTSKSLAVRVFSNPVAGTMHILLTFLISKLLF